MVAPRQKKSHNNIVYIVLGVVIVGIVIGTTKFVGHSATTKSKSEKKISVLTYANWNPFEYGRLQELTEHCKLLKNLSW